VHPIYTKPKWLPWQHPLCAKYRQYLHSVGQPLKLPSITNCLVAIVKPAIAILVPKLVAMATTLRHSFLTIFSSNSLTRKPTPRIKQRVASYHTTKVTAHQSPQSQLWQIASQNWLPWQRPSAPLDSHLTHDSLDLSKPKTQAASRSVQPFLQGSLV